VKKEKTDRLGRRLAVLGLVAFFVVAGLAAQLGNLTLKQQDQFVRKAEAQRTRQLPVFAPRGVVYDRHGVPLVTNRPAHAAFIDYPHFKNAEVRARLAAFLGLPVDEIEELVARKEEAGTYYEPIKVKEDLSAEQVAAILENRQRLPGVQIVVQPVREYVHGEMAAHLLGYVSEISEVELASRKKDGYLSGELIGQSGIEAYYESVLRGRNGWRRVEIDNFFQPLGETQEVTPTAGYNIHLTIDAGVQKVAERALDWTMWRIRNTIIGDGPWPNARAGAVVVMDVRTGAILAMASRPAFDPNLFVGGIARADWARLNDEKNLSPMLNRAIQTQYQPGSTWKMMTSAAALHYGVVSPHETYPCSGVYDKIEQKLDWVKWGHGRVDTAAALKGSCNIYYYEMGYRLGVSRLVQMAEKFGFGRPSGVDLFGEAEGFLPTDEVLRQKEIAGNPWGPGYTLSAAIGQIVAATPLQMARFTAALANGGKVLQPHLVSRVADAEGRTLMEFEPRVQHEVTFRPEHLKAILDGMWAVQAPGGTSDFAINPFPLRTAGKTGSAEYPPQDDYGHFVAFAPLENPEIAVAITIEQAAHGSNTSPIARAIFAEYFGLELRERDWARVPSQFPGEMAAIRKLYRVVGTGE
jgi:penicillin-binding protein 2